MVFFRYDDIPGVIGKVGTMFGENGANIANMAVSRTRDGQQALMALSVDEPPSDALDRRDAQRRLRRCDLHRARLSLPAAPAAPAAASAGSSRSSS